jgi:Plastocyanin
MKRALFSVAAVLVLALPASSSAATATVKIGATSFSPKTVTVNQGDAVEWTNVDKVNHQLVANNGAFASSILRPTQKFAFTFNVAGTFNYHDALKPSMTGTVVVKGPPPSISLGATVPIVFYGGQTTISGAVSSAKANESVMVLAQPFGSSTQQVATLITGNGGAFVYTTIPTVLTVYSVKWKGVEPAGDGPGPSQADAQPDDRDTPLRQDHRLAFVRGSVDLRAASLVVRPVGDGGKAEARAALRPDLQGSAQEGHVHVSRVHDHQPGGFGLSRHLEQLGEGPIPPLTCGWSISSDSVPPLGANPPRKR